MPERIGSPVSNPMAILTWRTVLSGARAVGLCHSVQGTAPARRVLRSARGGAELLGGRINHQAWFLTLEHRGQDLYPRLRSHLDDPKTLALEPVRFELMRRFGYFVTESSGHASEYLPYFASGLTSLASLVKTFESAESDYSAWFGYGQTGGCMASMRLTESAYEQEVDRQVAGTEPVEFRRSDEYGARIIHAAETGTPFASTATCPTRSSSQLACRGVRRSPLPGGSTPASTLVSSGLSPPSWPR